MGKIAYLSKKDCISKLNYLRDKLKKFNLRAYEEDGRWYLTHSKDIDGIIPPTSSQLMEAVFLYTYKFGSDEDKVFIKKVMNKIETIKKDEIRVRRS